MINHWFIDITCRSSDFKIFKPLVASCWLECPCDVPFFMRHLVGKKPEVSGEAEQSRQRHVPEPEKIGKDLPSHGQWNVNGVNLRWSKTKTAAIAARSCCGARNHSFHRIDGSKSPILGCYSMGYIHFLSAFWVNRPWPVAKGISASGTQMLRVFASCHRFAAWFVHPWPKWREIPCK